MRRVSSSGYLRAWLLPRRSYKLSRVPSELIDAPRAGLDQVANVFDDVPGGEQLKLSGTSMASPQVANLAGKLFAMRPDLTVAQVKELIMKGAERNGRVNMIHPKATLKLAGVKL